MRYHQTASALVDLAEVVISRDKVSKLMPPTKFDEAQHIAREWLKAYPK